VRYELGLQIRLIFFVEWLMLCPLLSLQLLFYLFLVIWKPFKCSIVVWEDRIIIKQYVHQEAQRFGIRALSCVILGYLGWCTVQFDCVLWESYKTCNSLDSNFCCIYKCTKNAVHQLYTDKLSVQLFDGLCTEAVNCCGIFGPNKFFVQIQAWC
jgi:hypothetical protein